MAKNEIELGFPILNLHQRPLAEVRITIKSDDNPNLIVELSENFLRVAGEVQDRVHSIPTSSSS